MKLRAKSRYVNEPLGVAYRAGDIFEVDAALAARLMTDSPETFEVYEEAPLTPKKQTKRVPVAKDHE